MEAVKALPPNYKQCGELDVAENKAVLIAVNALALVLILLFIWLALQFFALVHPGVDAVAALWQVAGTTMGIGSRVILMLVALAVFFGVGVVHELVHGLFFWIFTRERPVFGFKSLYVYAAAPDWYLPLGRYIVVGLMPLVVITVLGLVFAAVVPATVGVWVLLFTVTNAGGAAGDMFAVVWLLRQPPGALARDQGTAIEVYCPMRDSDKVIQAEE
ncbi:MAG: DUF3267 domain-containing protein [Anaerolineae bacterium]|nr:DUF3267 domain-containing protein [Anaerolineae bacterium]